jgi:hypothetical protein
VTSEEYDATFNTAIMTTKGLIRLLKRLLPTDREVVLNLLEEDNICEIRPLNGSYTEKHWETER